MIGDTSNILNAVNAPDINEIAPHGNRPHTTDAASMTAGLDSIGLYPIRFSITMSIIKARSTLKTGLKNAPYLAYTALNVSLNTSRLFKLIRPLLFVIMKSLGKTLEH